VAKPRTESGWRALAQLTLFAVLLTAGLGLILSSELLFMPRVSIQEGQAASEDIAAPFPIEFESPLRTKEAQGRAVAAVNQVYDPLDRQVGREQIQAAQQILDFVSSVRADTYAESELQQRYLASIDNVTLSPRVISDTLMLSDAEWGTVQQETRRVLAQVMREEIKSGQEDAYRLSVRSKIDFELSEPQTAIVSEIAGALVKANRQANPEATEAARQAALESVPRQMRVLAENQTIVRGGEIVTAEDIEALEALGLLHPQIDWLPVSGIFLFASVLAVATSAYLWHSEPVLVKRPLHLLLLLLLLTSFTLLAKWGVGLAPPLPYLVPLAALGMLVTALFNVRLGLVAQVILSLAVGYMADGQLALVLYHLVGGLVGIFSLRRITRISTFVWAGVYVMSANVAVTITSTLQAAILDTLFFGQSILASVINGTLSAILTLGGYSLLGMVFNIMTKLQLLDLARPTHPLMRQLLLKAPGTYHHSIMVGNMAEQAAEAIGADALLARVGAFYHDIGKTVRPYFFTENQMENPNPHDLLDPETSAQIIRSHTSDGLELARKYRLPRALQDFITQHHGTAKISYFYHKASQEYGKENVNADLYRHTGPRPQTKETAIVMMADSCEAAVRSVHPGDAKALDDLVRKIIGGMVSSGQLNEAPLTLREIDYVASSFVDTLQGVFHPRISYPSDLSSQDQARAQPQLEPGARPAGGAPVGGAPADTLPDQGGREPRAPIESALPAGDREPSRPEDVPGASTTLSSSTPGTLSPLEPSREGRTGDGGRTDPP
jgi:putative nucleotidyltransferase with HDIG domain